MHGLSPKVIDIIRIYLSRGINVLSSESIVLTVNRGAKSEDSQSILYKLTAKLLPTKQVSSTLLNINLF